MATPARKGDQNIYAYMITTAIFCLRNSTQEALDNPKFMVEDTHPRCCAG